MGIKVPKVPRMILEQLGICGFEAYAVGGCVRDSLMQKTPNDWDITTNALPEEVKQCFGGYRIIDTGLRHGTVTLVYEDVPYEITTYRTDGEYSDGRHPDKVSFSKLLTEDLARRDFTINAIAADAEGRICDPFGGVQAVADRVIQCVGEPDCRFREDALRILRALRFASQLGFVIEPQTAAAIHRNRDLLHNISAERIAKEFIAILCGDNVYNVLTEYSDVLAVFIPEVADCVGFEQNNPYHCYDVYQHIAHSVHNVLPEPVLRLTMFLHDIGKPQCYSVDALGNGHFYGHNKASSRIAMDVLSRLRLPNKVIDTVVTLVKYHDLPLQGTPKFVLRMLNKIGEEQFRNLLAVHRADSAAQSVMGQQEQNVLIKQTEAALEEVLLAAQAFSLRDMAIKGRDIIELGVAPGKRVGELLDMALDAVMNGLPNDKAVILEYIKARL